MTVYRKIALLMLTVFMIVYGVGALLYIQQARHDVLRELDGVTALARSLDAPDRLTGTVIQAFRHLRPATETPARDEEVPGWFTSLVSDTGSHQVINGWRLDPADEVEEIWEGFLLVSSAYALGMMLCFVALYLMIRRGLGVLDRVARALDAVSEGQLTSRLPRQDVQEFDALVCRFNAMAQALETEQQTVSRLMNELLRLQDREREHIARVLHDDLGQYLTGIRAQAQSLLYAPDLNPKQKQQARELAGHCETVQQHFRHLLQDLHPLVMEQLGLASAIRHLAEQWQQLSGLPCHLELDERLPEFTGEQQTHLYRFLQEALNNISRHADASCASLAVATTSRSLSVEISDDGVGHEQLPANAGLGMRSMRERARCLGGDVEIYSLVGRGTQVRLAVPLSRLMPTPGGAV